MPQTQWRRDPLRSGFQTDLRWGYRFLQASLVLQLNEQDPESSSRTIPVRYLQTRGGRNSQKSGESS